MRRKVYATAIVLTGVWAACAAWYALRHASASFGYGIRADFESVPPDDSALEQWWQDQPGVARVIVDRHGRSVGVLWIQVQTVRRREPPVPDYRAAFDRLGYRGLKHVHYDWRGSGDW